MPSPVEAVAVLAGLACVILTIRRSIWCWPAGLVQVGLYVYVFWQARLYSDMGLHVVYVGLCLYGWWSWAWGGAPAEGDGRAELPITRLTPALWVVCLAVSLAGTLGLGLVMSTRTAADLPYWDAATTVLSLVAQVLMARKKLESWLFWIAVDVLAIGVYYVKALHLTLGLYAVFLVLATIGWLGWRRAYRVQRGAPA